MLNKKDKAILVGLDLINSNEKTLELLYELEHLALAADIKTVEIIVQKAERVNPKFYIGSGKVLEIKKSIEILTADLVIFDDPLSPSQINNLEEVLDCKVIDRSFLILSIFASRATSKQSMLEISLAQKEYMLPRLIGLGRSLSRQGGSSFNAKGPGETQLELDRRKLLTEIAMIKRELQKIKLEKETSRKKRKQSQIPIVALVGYTNVGKSSLMNSLSLALNNESTEVFEKDMLFATLDTKIKRLQKDNNPPFLLVDTVGFIRKLPHELVRSFESTLKDIIDADLVIIVADGANFNDMQITATAHVLNTLGIKDNKRLIVLTKKEIALKNPILNDEYIFVSNKSKENIDLLINTIYNNIYDNTKMVSIKLPYLESSLFSHIKNTMKIVNTDYYDEGYLLKIIIQNKDLPKIEKFLI